MLPGETSLGEFAEAAAEEEEHAACGMHGHAKGTKAAPAPVLQKWLRMGCKTERARTIGGRLLLLPALSADDDPAQQA